MTVEVFTLCDNVQNYADKLVIVGTFDSIFAKSLPAIHPVLSVAIKLRYRNDEQGSYRLRLEINHDQGSETLVGIDGQIDLRAGRMDSSVANLAFNIVNTTFKVYGDYSAQLKIEGEVIGKIPFYVQAVS
jgi:hypothetical protein